MEIGAITNSYQAGYRGYESTGVAKTDTFCSELKDIPREIWTAWIEAQEELGVNGNDTDSDEKLMHVGLKLMHQISEAIKGKQNSLVGMMQSALKILEKALQDLETASKSTTENTEEQKVIKKENEFYQSFIKNLESMILNKYIEEGIIKIQNGDTEPTFAIGNQTFTLKEWDELLKHFDEAENAIKQLIEDKIEKRMKKDLSSNQGEW